MSNPLFGQVMQGSGGDPYGKALDFAGMLLSPAIGAGMSYKQSKKLMLMQQSWLEHMSNTAYQRQVKDLVAAGINPLYGLSGGASTPSAGLAAAPDYASAFSMGAQNAISRTMSKAQINNLESQSRLADFNAVKTGYESDLTSKEVQNYDERFKEQMNLLKAQAHAALESGSASSAQASYYNSLKLGQDITNLGAGYEKTREIQFNKWLETHPFARWRYYNDRAGFVPGLNLSGGFQGTNFSNVGFKK